MPVARVQFVDSHTEGEPTRVIVSGGPDLGAGTVATQAARFREHFDWFRAAVCNEPRGWDAMVGALIVPPASPRCVCGVIFFNNVGLLNACGHGTIGLAATLRHLGKISTGRCFVETPVGEVAIDLAHDGSIAIDNVPAFRHASSVHVPVPWEGSIRHVTGDIAWGGNWFFLVSNHVEPLTLHNIDRLTSLAWSIRTALDLHAIRGDTRLAQGLIDHVELFGPPSRADCDARNFVLCPGKAYDRSPCGTGTSAKMACLFADNKLAPDQLWRQESIIGSRFVGSLRHEGDALIPTIRGGAWVTSEGTLLLDSADPFVHGIR